MLLFFVLLTGKILAGASGTLAQFGKFLIEKANIFPKAVLPQVFAICAVFLNYFRYLSFTQVTQITIDTYTVKRNLMYTGAKFAYAYLEDIIKKVYQCVGNPLWCIAQQVAQWAQLGPHAS